MSLEEGNQLFYLGFIKHSFGFELGQKKKDFSLFKNLLNISSKVGNEKLYSGIFAAYFLASLKNIFF